MASYQTRQRDPLLDQNVQAMLERRGKELLGLAFIAAAAAATMMLWTYTPEDPGWMVATDEPARNALGRFGAAAASTLTIICGKGAWAIPVVLLAWGLRFLTHRGEDRALGRMIFAVIGVALASVFAATHVPGAEWTHSFGLGGLFGDTIVGALLGVLPFGAGAGLRLLSVAAGVSLVGIGLFVTGFDRAELKRLVRFLLVSLVMTYAAIADLLGRGAAGTTQAARGLRDRRDQQREAARLAGPSVMAEQSGTASLMSRLRQSAPPSAQPAPLTGETRIRAAVAEARLRAEPRFGAEPPLRAPATPEGTFPAPIGMAVAASRPRGGLLGLIKRAPEPELVEPALSPRAAQTDAPPQDRISARISDAIRARVRPGLLAGTPTPAARVAAGRQEPPVVARQITPAPALPEVQP
jgi:DNA segregation ATPase FtsK/SpoIIIE, S-DNA-T family